MLLGQGLDPKFQQLVHTTKAAWSLRLPQNQLIHPPVMNHHFLADHFPNVPVPDPLFSPGSSMSLVRNSPTVFVGSTPKA